MKAQPHETLTMNGWRTIPAGEWASSETLSRALCCTRQAASLLLERTRTPGVYVRTGRYVRRLTALADAETLRRKVAPKTPAIRPDVTLARPLEYLLATDLAALTRTPSNTLRTRLRDRNLLTMVLGGEVAERTTAEQCLLDAGLDGKTAAAPLAAPPANVIRWRTLPKGAYVSLEGLSEQTGIGESALSVRLNGSDRITVGCRRLIPLAQAQTQTASRAERKQLPRPPLEPDLLAETDCEYLLASDLTELARLFPQANPSGIPATRLAGTRAYPKQAVLQALNITGKESAEGERE